MSEEKATADQEVFLENGGRDDPDGLLRKKKKNKNKVTPSETDVITSEDEQAMAMKKVLELEKELLDMKSMKNESDDQVKGLKYELNGLQKNFKELKESSTKSLEELEKFEVTRLSTHVEDLKKENQALQLSVEKTMTQQITNQKGKELMSEELHVTKNEVNDLKIKLEALDAERQNILKEMGTSKNEMTRLKEQLKQQEATNEEQKKLMETMFKDKENKSSIEKDSLLKELHNEREKQTVAKSEMNVLKSEIEKIVKEKEEEKSFRIKMAERLRLLIDEKNKMEASYKLDLEQLSSDFEDLKNHLMHITTDKAEIFKKLNDSLHEVSKERWVRDGETTSCTNCKDKFTFKLRRHHCRLCGHIFCFKCSGHWLLTPHNSKRVRSCDVCADAYTETHVQVEHPAGQDKDFIDAPPQYRELKGDEIEKYEIEGEEETKEDTNEETKK